MAAIARRGKGQWQAKIRRAGYPSLSKTFNTKVDAESWARLIESEMDRGIFISRAEAETTTLAEALTRYLTEITPNKKGAKQEASRIKGWLRHPLSNRFLATVRSADIASYRDERLAHGLSPITVNNELIVINHLFNIARKEWGMEGLLNPVSNIRKPKLPSGRDRRLLEGEEQKLLDGAPYPLCHLIVLALETGMRLGELLGLEWEQIDLTRGVIVLPDTKNGDARSVPLSTRARNTIREMPRHLSGRVFPFSKNGNISHKFSRRCREVGIQGLRFHDLRHEATSRLFEKGLDSMEVSAVTGHKTLQMLKRYTHLKAEDLAKKLG